MPPFATALMKHDPGDKLYRHLIREVSHNVD
jgi:hypothetical protein